LCAWKGAGLSDDAREEMRREKCICEFRGREGEEKRDDLRTSGDSVEGKKGAEKGWRRGGGKRGDLRICDEKLGS